MQFETDTLPRFIETQRWYAAKGTPIERARIADHVLWQEGEVELAHGAARGRRRAAKPPATSCRWRWPGRSATRSACATSPTAGHRQDPPAVERRRDGRCLRRRGVLPVAGRGDGEAAGDRHGAGQAANSGPTAAFKRLAGADFGSLPAARPQGSSSNTVVVLGERLILKGYRRLRSGREPGARDGSVSDGRRALRQLRAAWPAPFNTATRTASPPCSRCCRPMSRIRATAGPSRSSTCGATSRSIAPRRPPTRRPRTRMRPTWR